MLKRLAATGFVWGQIPNLVATFVKPCHKLSAIVIFFSRGKVASSVGPGL